LVNILEITLSRKQGLLGKQRGLATRNTDIGFASLYSDAGQTSKAKDLYGAILLGSKPETDAEIRKNNLALVQCHEGKFKDAEMNLTSIVEARKRDLAKTIY
jgi:hypothetical protein